MPSETLLKTVASGDRLLLDTSVLAAYFDGGEASHPVARYVVDDLVCSGRNPAVVSMVSVMEILIRPMRATPDGHHTVLGFLRSQPYLDLVPIDTQVAQDAAHLRAMQRFSSPDALIVGTGLSTQVRHLVTNDLAWKAKLADMASRITVIRLADYLPFP